MLIAVRNPNKQQGKKRTSEVSSEVSAKRVEQARLVIEFCPEVVDQVREGKVGLDEALKEAQRRRAVGLATETRFERLRAERRVGLLLKELERATPQTANRAGANQHSSPATVAAEHTPYREAIDANGISERSARRYQQLADVPAPVSEDALQAPRIAPAGTWCQPPAVRASWGHPDASAAPRATRCLCEGGVGETWDPGRTARRRSTGALATSSTWQLE